MSNDTTFIIFLMALTVSLATVVIMQRASKTKGPFKKYPMIGPVIILLLGMLAFPAFTVYYATQIVTASNERWCTLLSDITFGPTPPKVPVPGPNATMQEISAYKDWKFYNDLTQLKGEIGCS